MTEYTNTPELRFPEFKDEWKLQKLGNLAQFSKGKSLSKKDLNINGTPCILYGELYTKYGAILNKVYSKTSTQNDSLVFSKRNQILIPSSGETDIDIATATAIDTDVKIAVGGDLNIITPINSDGRFISLYINGKGKYNLAKYAQGKSVVHLYNSDIKKLNFYLPTNMVEQKKIGDFFSKLDQQIELEEKKLELLEQQKRGYMQKIFSQELRFKDENGNAYPKWEEIKLKEILEVSKRKNTDSNYDHNDVLSVSREFGVINQIKYHGRSFAAKSVKNYKVVKPNSLIYTKSPLKGAPYGIFKVSFKNGIVSPLYAVYESNNKYITNFISRIFEFDNIITYYLSKLVSKGAKNTINVTDEMAISGKISIPQDENEIQDIINFFDTFDKLLIKQNEKINNLKQLKQGLLQKMFV